MRLTLWLSAIALGLAVTAAPAQEPPAPAGGAVVSGAVFDSVAGGPLAGVLVQLVSASDPGAYSVAANSDASGRFVFRGVPAGRYHVGFHHPKLDSLGLGSIARAVSVEGQPSIEVDLAIPPLSRVQAALCEAPAVGQGGGLMLGMVRDAGSDAPVVGATVVTWWREITVGKQGVESRVARREVTTHDNGWFVLCDVPSPGALILQANRGADSTDMVETEMPAAGFLRRDFMVGEATVVQLVDSAGRARASRRTGSGRVSGIVIQAEDGQPLAGAWVRVVNGPETRADAQGEWALAGAPSGTRVLEARAPGFLPIRRAVDIGAGAAPVRLTLSRLTVVLDTLRAVASSRRSLLGRDGFMMRQRTTAGRFYTEAALARRAAPFTSRLFANMPGIDVERDSTGQTWLFMRSSFHGGRCIPAIALNSHILRDITADDLDGLVEPEKIAALEVYREQQVPPQFQVGMGGCGSIVIWTK